MIKRKDFKSIVSDLESEKENDLSPSSTVTYKPRVPYP